MPTKNGGNIKFNIDFNVNKNSLNQINESLHQVQLEAAKNPLDENFKKAAQSAKQLQNIFKQSWNDKLGQLNLSKFNQDLKASGQTVDSLKNTLGSIGETGRNAFNQVALEVLHTNTQMKQTSKLLDSMATSMANTVKWGITSSIFNNITGTIQQAYYFTKDLDTSLNNIRIVTGDSADEMDRFARTANEAAKSLGKSTLDYTKAALTFYQQGLSDEQVQARTQTTLKAQNVTGSGSEMADYLTSVWNGFKISAEDTEQVVDKLAKVADSSASDMSQLAIAMSKVAATASVMGVDIDQLTAQLATVIATTRQAPESVGTAFKTIYSRLNDIKTGADDAEISLGNYSSKMADLGFNVLDANGRLRDTGQVMEQIGSRWSTLSKEQQIYLAQTMGGMRQVTQITALFENWATYSELLNDSLTAQGSLNEKNDVYLESVRAHLNQLNAEVERTYQILSDTGAINAIVDALNGALGIFNNFIKGLGGGIPVLTYFGSLAVGIFNKQISESILRTKRNLDLMFDTKKIEKFKQDYANAIIEVNKGNINPNNTVQYEALSKRAEKEAEIYTETLKIRQNLTQQQQKELDTAQKKLGELEQEKVLLSNLTELKRQYGYEDYTTTTQFEIREKSLKKQAQQLGTLLSLLKERLVLEARINSGDAGKDEEKRYKEIGQQLAKNNTFLRIQEDLIKKKYSGEQLTNKIVEQINAKYKISKDELQTVLKLKELQIKADEQSNEKLGQQETIYTRILNKLKESAKQRDFTQTIVKRVSALGQALSVAAGAMKTFGDETSTTADKVQASISGFQGIVSAISPFLPGGFATGILVNGAISLFTEVFDLDERLTDIFSTTAQKIQKVNQTLKETNTQISNTNKNISSLQKMEEEYAILAEKAGDYGSTIENLTDEEKERYFELNNKFAEYNQSVIAGWDSQGNAIIANQEKVKDLIQLYRDAQKENINQNFDIKDAISTENQKLRQPYEDYANEKENNQNILQQSNLVNMRWEDEEALSDFLSFARTDIQNFYGTKGEKIPLSSNNNEGYVFNTGDPKKLDILFGNLKQTLSNIQNIENYTLSLDELDNLAIFRDVYQRLSNEFLADPETVQFFDRLINNVTTYQEKLAVLEASLEETQKFDDNFITTVLEWGDGYSEQYEKLYNSKFYDSNIEQIFLNYIRGFVYDPKKVFDETGILIDENGQKYAKDYESIFQSGRDFAQNLANVLNQYESQINTVIEKYNNGEYDAQLKDLTFNEKNEKLAEILNEALATIDLSSIEDEDIKKGLIDYLASIFNIDLSTLEINFKNENDVVEKVETQSSSIIDKLVEEVQGQLDKMGVTFNLSELIKANLGQITEQDIPILQNIDWKEIINGNTTFLQAFNAAKDRAEQLSNVIVESLNDTIGADTIIEKVTKNKSLTKDEQNYLSLLLQQDSTLLTLKADNEKFTNAVYAAQEKLQGKYRENLQLKKAQAEVYQRNAELQYDTLITSGKATDEEIEAAKAKVERYKAQAALIQQDLDVADATWNIENAKRLEEQTKDLKKATEQARDLLNQNYQRENTTQVNAEFGLNTLKEGKKALSNDQLGALVALELQDQKLNQIAEERGRHSKEYIAQLEESLKQHQLITEQLKEQRLATLELEKTQLSNQKRALQQAMLQNPQSLDFLQQRLTDVNNQLTQNAKEIASVTQDEFENTNKTLEAIEAHQKTVKQNQQQNQKIVQQNQKATEEHKQNIKKLNQQELKDFQNVLKTLKDSNSIIKDLKNHSLNADQLQAISYLMQVDQNFANIVDQNGYFSDATIETLEQLLSIQEQITDQTSQQLSNRLKSERIELQAERDRLQSSIDNYGVSEQQYNQAKTFVSGFDTAPTNLLEYQQASNIIALYEHQVEVKQQILNLDEQIRALLLQELGLGQETVRTNKQNLQTFTALRDKLISGKGDLSDSQLSDLTLILKDLTKIYPQLITDADLLTQTELAGTDAYQDALNRVQDILTQLNFQDLAEQASEAFAKIEKPDVDQLKLNIEVDPQAFEQWVNTVEDYLNVDKKIVIAVHTDAEDSFNHLVDEINQIQNAASKIGENFIIAGQDMRMLNQVFPGILENMQYLENGSIQLSDTVVRNALATAKNTITADTESTNAQLDSQAQLLREKAATYRAMAEEAAALAETESLTSEESAKAQERIFNALAQQEADSNGQFIQAASINLSKLSNSSDDNSRIMASNIASAATSSTDSFSRFVSTTINNLNILANAVANAMQGRTTSAWISGANGTGSSYSGSRGTGVAQGIKKGSSITVGSKVAAQAKAEMTSQDWKRLSQQLFNQANIYQQQANDIEGMKYLLDSRLQGLNSGIGNVSSGYDWSGPKESSSKSSSPKGSSRSSNDSLDDGGDSLDDGTGGMTGDPEVIDFIEDAKDLYHDVNIELRKIEVQLQRVRQQQERLIGADVVAGLNKELDILDKQIDRQKEKIKIQQQEARDLKQSLLGYGVTFNSDDTISNYSEIMTKRLDEINSYIAIYNSLSNFSQETQKARLEKEKEQYQTFLSQLQRYDEIISQQIPDLTDEIRDAIDQQIEANVKKFNLIVDIELDLTKAERKWNDFVKDAVLQLKDQDVLENTKFLFSNLTTYFRQGNDEIDVQIRQIRKVMEELDRLNQGHWSQVYGDDMATALDDLNKLQNSLMSSLQDAEQLINKIKDSIFDGIDKAQQAFDDQVNQYQYISDLINHNVKMVELLYGKDAYDMMSDYFKTQERNNNKQIEFLRLEKDMWHDKMVTEQARLNPLDSDSNYYKEAEARLKEYEQHWMKSTQELNKMLETSIQNIINKYANAIEITFNNLEKKMTNGFTLDNVSEEWELINKQAEVYLDRVNSMYEIEKLQNAYQQAIDDNGDNLNAQKSLNNMMEEQIKYLKDKDKLTKYDVDRANALLQIEVKRLAVQQASQNKTKLRLRRDAQGNYTYQYTADEDEQDNAQKDLLAAQNDLYNLTKNAYKDNLNSLYSSTKEWEDKIKEIYKDTTLSAEQRQKKIAMYNEYYGNIINGYTKQNEQLKTLMAQDTVDSLKRMYETNTFNFSDMTQEQANLVFELIKNYDTNKQAFSNLTNSQKENFDILKQYYDTNLINFVDMIGFQQNALGRLLTNYTENKDSFKNMTDTQLLDLKGLTDQYYGNLNVFQNMTTNQKTALEELIKKYGENSSNFSNMAKNQRTELNSLVAQYKTHGINYSNLTNSQKKALGSLIHSYQENASNFTDMTDTEKSSLQELSDKYDNNLEDYIFMTDQQRKALGTLIEAYRNNYTSFEGMTSGERQELKNLIKQYEDNVLSMNNMTKQQAIALNSLGEVYGHNTEAFDDMSEDQKNIMMQKIIPQWNSTINTMANTFTGEGGFIPTVKNAFDQLNYAVWDYESSLNTLSFNAGVDFDNIDSSLYPIIEDTELLINTNQDLIDQYDQEIDAIDNVIVELDKLTDTYKTTKKAAIDAASAAKNYWSQVQKQTQTAAAQNFNMVDDDYVDSIDIVFEEDMLGTRPTSTNRTLNNVSANRIQRPESSNRTINKPESNVSAPSNNTMSNTSFSTSTNSTTTTASTTTASNSSRGDGVPKIGDLVTFTNPYYYGDSYGGNGFGSQFLGKEVRITHYNPNGIYPYGISQPTGNSPNNGLGWVKLQQLSGYDTGGYTGNWHNKDGKLALLHEKELVLNKDDTRNILSAVSIVKTMNDLLSSIHGNFGLSSLVNSLSNKSSNSYSNSQQVHIDAHFPNVSNHLEIEQALVNLTNKASQYAFSTMK